MMEKEAEAETATVTSGTSRNRALRSTSASTANASGKAMESMRARSPSRPASVSRLNAAPPVQSTARTACAPRAAAMAPSRNASRRLPVPSRDGRTVTVANVVLLLASTNERASAGSSGGVVTYDAKSRRTRDAPPSSNPPALAFSASMKAAYSPDTTPPGAPAESTTVTDADPTDRGNAAAMAAPATSDAQPGGGVPEDPVCENRLIP